jgi:RNA polymerase sigma-70 factor (ECF subfamily)
MNGLGSTHVHQPSAQTNRADEGAAFGQASDRDLLAAMASRSPDALAEVYDRHRESVYGLVDHLCGSRHADEVTRLVFLALWHSPQNFPPRAGSLLSGLLADAHSRAVVLLRGDAASLAVESKLSIDELEQKILGLQPPSVRRSLAGLPSAQRSAVTLTYFGGYTYRQVAVLVQRPEETVLDDLGKGLRLLGE